MYNEQRRVLMDQVESEIQLKFQIPINKYFHLLYHHDKTLHLLDDKNRHKKKDYQKNKTDDKTLT